MQQPRIKAVIFDMGGVILRTGDPQPRETLAARFGLTLAEMDEVVFQNPVAQAAESGQATQAEVWAEVGRRLNIPPEQLPEVAAQFFAGDQLDLELVHFIESLRPRYTTALLSNTWIKEFPAWLKEKWQLPEAFEVIISSAQYQMAKPDPQIFRLALKLVKAEPQETIFVDDFPRNIAAANLLGIHTILFKNAEQTIEALKRLLEG